MPQEVDAEGSRTGSGGASAGLERGASARGRLVVPDGERVLAGELERAREALAAMTREKERVEAELEALRREVRGVEVHDVEAGVSRVEERGEEEPAAKRVRREQDARARVCGMLQARLVAVKKEAAACCKRGWWR